MNKPGTLEEFLGNGRIVEILRRAVAKNRLPHAILFAGPRGVGKRTLARLLAQLLNCTGEGVRPCGSCPPCRKIRSNSHPDVHEIAPDGSFIRNNQIRELISQVAYQPFEGRYQVAIIDNADQMRAEGANSLLKTLEEPPGRAVLILVTANPYALLGTILSRCRILTFAAVSQKQITDYLVKDLKRTPDEARMAAALSNGSIGAAISLDVAEYPATRDRALRFVRTMLLRGSFAAASGQAADLAKDKEGFQLGLDTVGLILQDVYYAQSAPGRMEHTEARQELHEMARRVPHQTVTAAIRAVGKLRAALLHNVNRQIALEALFLAVSGGQ